MQWLSLVSEDTGVQRLKAADRAPARTGRLEAVAQYPSAHPVQVGERRADQRPPRVDRRRGERRDADRRTRQIPVLLDTRSQHQRRAVQDRRRSGGETATTRRGTGIDVYA